MGMTDSSISLSHSDCAAVPNAVFGSGGTVPRELSYGDITVGRMKSVRRCAARYQARATRRSFFTTNASGQERVYSHDRIVSLSWARWNFSRWRQ